MKLLVGNRRQFSRCQEEIRASRAERLRDDQDVSCELTFTLTQIADTEIDINMRVYTDSYTSTHP